MTWGDEFATGLSLITGDDSDVIRRIKAHRADGTMKPPTQEQQQAANAGVAGGSRCS